MKAWQEGLGGPPPVGRVYRPEDAARVDAQIDVEPPPSANDNSRVPASDDRDEDPEIQVSKREDIVPRRPGAASSPMPEESFWSSHLFWKGIVIGAAIVFLVKTAMAVHTPFGIDWYRF
ncbi:MAG: hypothetical protein ACR2RA_10215 [Geminicoccaceae bacterium]